MRLENPFRFWNRIRPIRGNYVGKQSSRLPRRVAVPLAAVGLWAACALLPRVLPDSMVSRFFLPLSRAVAVPIKLLSGLFPFSLLELLILSLPLLAGALFFVDLDRLSPVSHEEREDGIGPLASGITTLAVMMAFFHIVLGFGYHALPLEQQLGYPEADVGADSLRQTAAWLADRAVELRPQAVYTDKKVAHYGRQFRAAYRLLAESLPVYEGYAARPKGAILSVPMSHLGIGGMYSPFTCEALINTDAAPASLPFTIAHEMAHSLQVAPENEANFSAFLACLAAEDASARYSGYFMGLLYTLSAYHRSDPAGYPDFYRALDPGIREDLSAYSTHVARYDGWLNEAHSKINDFFLKSNGQTAGVQSYGLMVNLLVAYVGAEETDGSASVRAVGATGQPSGR